MMDRRDWREEHLARRRNCWFVCRYGKSGNTIDQIKHWPFSKLREACADIAFWMDQEAKNAKRK